MSAATLFDRETDRDRAFARFHAANPGVYALFRKLAERRLEASEVACRRLRAELVRTEADLRALRNQIAARREAVA